MVPLHARCVARTSTSRSRAAAAAPSAVRDFPAGASLRRLRAAQVQLSCVGESDCPMQHELLFAGAHVLAMLQHSSLHTCPHTWPQRWHSFFECRPDLKLPLVFRVQVGSEAADPILGGDNAISVLQIRDGAT